MSTVVSDATDESIGPHDALVVYANHASWWDPLTAIFVAQQLFGDFPMYAPIDADALRKYPMFARMGFFGVEQHSLRGAAHFLRMADRILSRPGVSLWITPEGRFADVRDTSTSLMPGLAHLGWKFSRSRQAVRSASADASSPPATSRRVWFIPAAVEYTFWEERQPELLFWFGQPISAADMHGAGKTQWDQMLTERLRSAQGDLANAVIARDASQFEILVGGRSGSFAVYDWWRKAVGLLRGQRVQVEHGQKLNDNSR